MDVVITTTNMKYKIARSTYKTTTTIHTYDACFAFLGLSPLHISHAISAIIGDRQIEPQTTTAASTASRPFCDCCVRTGWLSFVCVSSAPQYSQNKSSSPTSDPHSGHCILYPKFYHTFVVKHQLCINSSYTRFFNSQSCNV